MIGYTHVFKDSRLWTGEQKAKLVRDVMVMRTEFDTREIFAALSKEYNTTASNLSSKYYVWVKEDPKAVQELMAQLDKEGVSYVNPYEGYTKRWDTVTTKKVGGGKVDTVVPEAAPALPENEDALLETTGALLEGLMKLQGSDTVGFLKGLTAIVNRAVGADFKGKEDAYLDTINSLEFALEEVREERDALQKRLEEVQADLSSASFMIEEYQKYDAARKVAKSGEFVTRLKVVIDKYGNVLSAKPEVV